MEAPDFKSPLPPRRITVVDEPTQPVPPTVSKESPESPEIITPRQTLTPAKKLFIPYLIGIFVIALLALLAFKFIIPYFKNKNSQPITLTYWGLWEESSVLQGIISEFESKNSNIKIININNPVFACHIRVYFHKPFFLFFQR